jgi:biopolymer transport protein ExbD
LFEALAIHAPKPLILTFSPKREKGSPLRGGSGEGDQVSEGRYVVPIHCMKFASRKRRAPSIIIVSLVDILTILLIFFVVSTTFKRDQPQVQINLPESKTATNAPAELEHAIVTVEQNDEIKLDGKPVAVEELEGAVKNLPETRRSTLALQADKKASFGTIVKVMDALKLAGVKNLPAFTRGE